MFHDDCVVVGCEKMLNPSSLFLPLSLFCPLQIGEVRWKIQRATHCVSFRKKGEPISSCVLLHRSAILWNALKLVPEYTYINWALLKRERRRGVVYGFWYYPNRMWTLCTFDAPPSEGWFSFWLVNLLLFLEPNVAVSSKNVACHLKTDNAMSCFKPHSMLKYLDLTTLYPVWHRSPFNALVVFGRHLKIERVQ